MERHRRTTAFRQILDVMLATYLEGMSEDFTLNGTGGLYLLLYAHIDFLPETGHAGHAGGVCLPHGLLHLLGVGVDNETGADGEAEQLPAFLKDVGERQEVEHTVVLAHRHALAVGHHSSMVLATGEDDALGVARGTAGIEYVGCVVHRGGTAQRLDLGLTGQAGSELQEIVEVHGGLVGRGQLHATVVNNDALERGTHGEHAAGLIVLVLLANKEDAHLGIGEHELYLLLGGGGIEGDGDGTNAPGAKVGEEVLHGVLGEDAEVLLHTHAEVQQGVGHLIDSGGELTPRHGLPAAVTKVAVDKLLAVAITGGLVVDELGQMT